MSNFCHSNGIFAFLAPIGLHMMGREVLNGFWDPSGPFWAILGQNWAKNYDFAAGTTK